MDLLIHIVDDDEVITKTLKQLVVKRGHRAVVSRTGEEALAKMREIVPDLIVLDLSLPDTNGIEVLKKIQRMNLPSPIIMVARDVVLSSSTLTVATSFP